jgi:hypothetical protein
MLAIDTYVWLGNNNEICDYVKVLCKSGKNVWDSRTVGKGRGASCGGVMNLVISHSLPNVLFPFSLVRFGWLVGWVVYSCCSNLEHKAYMKRFVSLQFLNL